MHYVQLIVIALCAKHQTVMQLLRETSSQLLPTLVSDT